jgi:hypothetical protein
MSADDAFYKTQRLGSIEAMNIQASINRNVVFILRLYYAFNLYINSRRYFKRQETAFTAPGPLLISD